MYNTSVNNNIPLGSAMMKYIKFLVLVFILTGCTTSCTTTVVNPVDPEMDSPILIGNTVNAPWGCILWRDREIKEQQKCCPLTPIVPSEETPDDSGWELKTWDC